MEIINLHKNYNKTKVVAKTAPKVPKSGYQEGGRRSKKILQGYLNIMIGQDRCKMKQRNRVMINKMKKRW